MKVLFYGIQYAHSKGEFTNRNIFDYYCVCCFETPFLYEMGCNLLEGNAGDMLIMEPGKVVCHGPRKDSEKGFVNDWMYIYGYEFEELLQRYPVPLNRAFSVGRQDFLRKYLEKIKKEENLRALGYQEKIDYILGEMVIDASRAYRRSKTLQTPSDRVELAREEIMQSVEKQWTLEEMAKISGYSQSRFSAIYKERFGVAPKQDIIIKRIENAKQMLKYSKRSIGDIATICGFQTIYYFSKYFKQITGMSPKEYADMHSTEYQE